MSSLVIISLIHIYLSIWSGCVIVGRNWMWVTMIWSFIRLKATETLRQIYHAAPNSVTQSFEPPQWPPSGQKKIVAIVENGLNKSQCTMYGLSTKKVAIVERWLLMEAWLSSIRKFSSNHVMWVVSRLPIIPLAKRIMILVCLKKVNIYIAVKQ